MKSISILLVFAMMPMVFCQDEENDRGLLHKKKKRPLYNQGSPCGYYRDLGPAASEQEDERSLPLVAAVGGAAAGLYLANKYQKHKYQQQPVINNYVSAGGYPCGGGGGGGGGYRPPIGGGGHIGSIGNHLASHVGPGGILGGTGGLFNGFNGNRNGYGSYGGYGGNGGYGGYGGSYGTGINWDRTIRQFNRNIVRPLAAAWF